MKVLLDTCVSRLAREALVAGGHDVVSAADWEQDPGDEEILARAHVEDRLVTLDKDFGALAVLRGLPHYGIIRMVGFRASAQGPVALAVLRDHEAALKGGALVTAEPGRVRLRL